MPLIARLVILLVTVAALLPLAPTAGRSARGEGPGVVPLVTRTLQLRPPTALGDPWKRVLRLLYGTTTAQLGTSPGGDGLRWGPDYGVQVPDRSWWFADAAKSRLAHYSDSGADLGSVRLPARYLHQGRYFQWDNPVALADGTVVLSSTAIDSPALLLLSPAHSLRSVPLAEYVHVLATDGVALYGFSEAGGKVRVDPATGATAQVTSFSGQGGHSYDISLGAGYLAVTRPGVNLRLDLVDPDHPSVPVHPAVEVAMGADGRLWIFVTGLVEVSMDEVHEVAGLFSVDLSGAVSAVSRVRRWYSESDPSDGQHLGMRYGGKHPTLMFIDTDAVRVYRKK